MKSCSNLDCKQKNPQPMANFNKNKKGRNGLYCHCRPCQRLTNKNRYLGENGRFKQWRGNIRKYWPELSLSNAYNEYMRLYKAQDGCCAICLKPETEIDIKYNTIKMLSVDHCHNTGKVRGLLCSKHNRGIGLLGDDPDLCLAAADYLIKTRKI